MLKRDKRGRFLKASKSYSFAHRYYFLIRWWLIGKYHCAVPKWGMRYTIAYLGNKVLWALITFCVLFTAARLTYDV